MSKAAELTREELVERLAKSINGADAGAGYPAWLMLVGSEREYYIARANAVLSELKALGLVLVPEVPTEGMAKAGFDGLCRSRRAVADFEIKNVWETMLSSSPFAGN